MDAAAALALAEQLARALERHGSCTCKRVGSWPIFVIETRATECAMHRALREFKAAKAAAQVATQ